MSLVHRDTLHNMTIDVIKAQVQDFVEATIPIIEGKSAIGLFETNMSYSINAPSIFKEMLKERFTSQGYKVDFLDYTTVKISWY